MVRRYSPPFNMNRMRKGCESRKKKRVLTKKEEITWRRKKKITFTLLDNFRCKPGKEQPHFHEYLNMAGILQNKIKLIIIDEHTCYFPLVDLLLTCKMDFQYLPLGWSMTKFRRILDQKCSPLKILSPDFLYKPRSKAVQGKHRILCSVWYFRKLFVRT